MRSIKRAAPVPANAWALVRLEQHGADPADLAAHPAQELTTALQIVASIGPNLAGTTGVRAALRDTLQRRRTLDHTARQTLSIGCG